MGYGSDIGVGTEHLDTPNRDWLLDDRGFRKTVIIEENSQDPGNAGERVTKLRSGLVMAKLTATGADQGKYMPCDLSLSNGRETAAGILLSKVDMIDAEGSTGDRLATIVFGPHYVDASKCYVEDASSDQQTLDGESTALTSLRGDGMVFKGDA